MKRFGLGCIFAVAALGMPAVAAPLGLSLLSAPDIFSSFIDVSYDAGMDHFEATGFALTLENPVDTLNPITGGLFEVHADVDEMGMLMHGDVEITGAVGSATSPLLLGMVTDFGFLSGGNDLFEFLFEVTGGSLAGLFGGSGATVGIILNAGNSTFTGSFMSDFDNLIGGVAGTGSGVSDTAPIPEPTTLLLAGLLVPFALRRR